MCSSFTRLPNTRQQPVPERKLLCTALKAVGTEAHRVTLSAGVAVVASALCPLQPWTRRGMRVELSPLTHSGPRGD